MKTRTLSRLVTTTLLALVLSSAALLAQAPAAGALANVADANVEYGNNNCGDPVLGAPVVGTARFLRSGDQMLVRYVMTGGDANTKYDVRLYDADTCSPIAAVGSFTSDAAGAGWVTSKKLPVAGSKRFYAAARDASTFVGIYHGSLSVLLP